MEIRISGQELVILIFQELTQQLQLIASGIKCKKVFISNTPSTIGKLRYGYNMHLWIYKYFKINISQFFRISCVAGDLSKEGFVVAMKELVDAWSLPKRTVIFVKTTQQ